MPPNEPDVRLRLNAKQQRGAFTLAQALAAPFSRPTVRRRLESGMWEGSHPASTE